MVGILVVAAQPDVVLTVDEDAVLVAWPIVSRTGAAPALHEVAVLIELEHRRGREAALGYRRIQVRAAFVVRERARTLIHPDVIMRVDGDPADLAEDPFVGQRFGPEWIDDDARRILSRREPYRGGQ